MSGIMTQAYDPSYSGGRGGIASSSPAWDLRTTDRGEGSVVECLLSVHEALASIPSTGDKDRCSTITRGQVQAVTCL